MKFIFHLGILVPLAFFQLASVLGNIDDTPRKDLTISNVSLLWKLSSASLPYLDFYTDFKEINATIHVVMFETTKLPVLEDNEINTNCISYGPSVHTDLTPTELIHLAQACYLKMFVHMENFGDEVRFNLGDNLDTETDLTDPDDLVAKAIADLPPKVGGVLAVKDVINIGIGNHDEKYLPLFKLLVDYEDYTGTIHTSNVCFLLTTTLEYLYNNELEPEIWDCRPLCLYNDVAQFSNFRFDDAYDSDLIENVWVCLRQRVLDDPVKWREYLEYMEELKERRGVPGEENGEIDYVPMSASELTINDVQLEWRPCEKGANYLDMVAQVEEFRDQDDVRRKMRIHAAILESGVPLKSPDIEYPTCLFMFGENAHSKLTSPILKNVTKTCYTIMRNNELEGKTSGERTLTVSDLTDEGYITKTSVDLNDPENLMSEVLNALPTRLGKVTRVKDLFMLHVKNKMSGEDEPILKYTVDYEDYEGNQHVSKTVCLLMADTMDTLQELGVDGIPLIWECEPLARYDDGRSVLQLIDRDLDDSFLTSEIWKCIKHYILDDREAWTKRWETMQAFRAKRGLEKEEF